MSLWIAPRPLVLASQSDIRRKLLVGAGIPVLVIAPEIDERGIEASLENPIAAADEVARRLANAKAGAVSRRYPEDLVLAADQVLVLDGRLFNKPSGKAEAAAQLVELSGRTHDLYCAFCLVRGEKILADQVAVATLTMRSFSAAFVDRYLDSAGPSVFECVGAYQLEGLGSHLFERIEGEHSTILGLPLLPLLKALRRYGVLAS